MSRPKDRSESAGAGPSAAAAPSGASGPWWRKVIHRSRHMPLRLKLVLLMCAVVSGALVSTGFAATTLLRHSLINRVDSQLTTESTQQVALLTNHGSGEGRRQPGGRALGVPIPNPSEPGSCSTSTAAVSGTTTPGTVTTPGAAARLPLPSDYFVQVSDSSGTVTFADRQPLNQKNCGPEIPSLAISAVVAHHDKPFTVPSRNGAGDRWRVLVAPIANGTGSVAVALPLTGVDSTLNKLALFELVIGGGVLVVLAGVSYVAVRRSLRPLIDVEHTAAAIAAGDLTQRVPESDTHTEVGKLAAALNGMLSQIETAFRAREESEREARTSEHRMRRFIGDASHELRTPLTSIRGFAELYRMGAVADEPDIDRVMTRIENEATRMGLLVDDLLLLARLDQQRPLERHLIDLMPIATDAAHDAHAVAPGRDVRLEVLTDEPVMVIGDDARLRQVVGNLVTNALTHTPESASVIIRLSVEETRADTDNGVAGSSGSATGLGVLPGARVAVLEVADTGPGLKPDDAHRVFERFYRVEESRTRAAGGSGLGLSIVAALTAAHGGIADVSTEVGKGSRFRIRIPLAANSPRHEPTPPPASMTERDTPVTTD
jgi:two-component system, OmpR family, sensor kinase